MTEIGLAREQDVEDTVQPTVKSHMTGSPISVEADASALSALDLMIDHGIRHLPVVGHQSNVVGVLSFDDLRAAFPVTISLANPPKSEDRPVLRDIAVGEVMTHAPVTVHDGQPLEEAAQLMADLRIGCLPVIDADGRLDGILSETDVLQALVTTLWAQRRGLTATDRPAAARDVVELLRDERDRIRAQLEDYERVERGITETETELPMDEAEEGADRTDAALTEALSDLAARRLRAIDHALERADRGELLQCERCEGTIPDGRLRALPGTTLCVRCARETEAGGA